MKFSMPKDPPRWYTVASQEGEEDFVVLLKVPSVPELMSVWNRCGMTGIQGSKPDLKLYGMEVAKRWFIDFRGFEDNDGVPWPNTLENRVELLGKAPIWKFITEIIQDTNTWRNEGNAVAG